MDDEIVGGNVTSYDDTHLSFLNYRIVPEPQIGYHLETFSGALSGMLQDDDVTVQMSFAINESNLRIDPNADGYYSLPQTAETVLVTAEGAVKDDSAPGGKLSFWELLIRFFQKIVAFFAAAFGKK